MQNLQESWFYVWLIVGVGGLALYLTGLRSGYTFLRNGFDYESNSLHQFMLRGIVTIPLVAIATPNSMLAGFGPGAWIWLIMWVALPVFGFIALKSISEWWNHRRIYQGSWVQLFLGVGIVGILVIAPYLGQIGIAEKCDTLHQTQLQPVIEGMERYKINEGNYPSDLDMLFSDYVATRPPLACFGEATDGYRIQDCEDDGYILVLTNYTRGFPIRYNSETARWSKISGLDGTCSFLD